MGNQGATKRKEENRRHLKNLLRFIIACNVVYLVVRVGIFHSTFESRLWFSFMLTFFTYVIPFLQLAMMAKPEYTEAGELLHGGVDLASGGVCEYFRGIIYIAGFVQLTSIISEKFTYLYLVIPAFATYKLLCFAKGFVTRALEGPGRG